MGAERVRGGDAPVHAAEPAAAIPVERVHPVLQLQRLAGNRAVSGLFVQRDELAADRAAVRRLITGAGRERPAARRLVAFAAASGVSGRSVLAAMDAAAQEATPADRLQAGNVFAIGTAASHAAAPGVGSGSVKVHVVDGPPMPAGLEAAYVMAPVHGLRGDTIHVRSTMRPDNLAKRAVVIHELEHAQQDRLRSVDTGQTATVIRAEYEGYRAQARYLLSQVTRLSGSARAAAAAQAGRSSNGVIATALVMVTQADRARFEPALLEILAANDPRLTPEVVRSLLGRTPLQIQTQIGRLITTEYARQGIDTSLPAGFDGWTGHPAADVRFRTGQPAR